MPSSFVEEAISSPAISSLHQKLCRLFVGIHQILLVTKSNRVLYVHFYLDYCYRHGICSSKVMKTAHLLSEAISGYVSLIAEIIIQYEASIDLLLLIRSITYLRVRLKHWWIANRRIESKSIESNRIYLMRINAANNDASLHCGLMASKISFNINSYESHITNFSPSCCACGVLW